MLCFEVILFAVVLGVGNSELLGAFVLPHGGIALDPRHFKAHDAKSKLQAYEVHDACLRAAETLVSLDPDLVVLNTPHGIADDNNFAIYENPSGSGTADTDNCKCPQCCYNVSVSMDNDTAADLLRTMRARGLNVTGFSAYGPPGQADVDFPLRWGEVIPLYFLRKLKKAKFLIFSQPSRRYTKDVEMVQELLDFGKELQLYFSKVDKKVVYVVSADLAHTHMASGPYGYSNTSEPFDLAVGQWAATMNKEYLLVTAKGLVDRALSCGYTGLVILQGMLTAADEQTDWRSKLYVNHHPSYYGMMVAHFLKRSSYEEIFNSIM